MSQFLKPIFIILCISFIHNGIAQDYKYPSDYAASLIGKNQLKETVSFCKKAIAEELNKTPVDSIEITYLYSYLSKGYSYQMGDANYLASIKACEDGMVYCPNNEEGVLQKARLYNYKSLSEFSTNLQYRSFKSNLKALELFSSVKQPDYNYMVNIYIDMSRTSVYNGNFEEAKRLLRQGERLYAEHKGKIDEERRNTTVGRIASYEFLLRYNKVYQLTELGTSSEDSLEISQTIDKLEELTRNSDFLKGGEGIFYTASLNEFADWYISRIPENKLSNKDLTEALSLVNKAITLVEDEQYGGSNLLYVYRYNRSKILMLLNLLDEAESMIENVIETTDYTSVNTPTFFAQKGRIESRREQKENAITAFRDALQKIHKGEEVLKDDLSNFSPSNIFKHNEVLYTIAKDLSTYFPEDKSVKKLVANIYKIGLSQFEASYDKRKYNKRQDLYLRRILQGLIKTKGWGYNEDISYPDLLNRYENIRNELVWLEFYQNRKTDNLENLDTLLSEKKVLITAIAEAQNENNVKKQDSLQTALELAQYAIDQKYPNINLLSEHNFSIVELQQQITEEECILKYVLLDDELAIFRITNDGIKVQLMDWNYQKELDELRLADFNNNEEKLKTFAKLFGDLLLPNIDYSYSSLIINPDGVLAKLPFEILIKDEQYLLDNYAIRYTSNLGFIFPKIEANSDSNLLAIYNPLYPKQKAKELLVTRSAPVYLEGAQNESDLISGYFPSELYKKDVSKTLFKETAPNASLLHLAMHADIHPSNSGLNRLLFDHQVDSNKNLSLEEIYGMKLSANLAVLSACNTGFGNDNDGRGMESFQRAFTFAGVPATVASLWEVPDAATKEIMVDFYKNLKNGSSKSKALQLAKKHYVQNHLGTKLEQPQYWAGFVIYGDNTAIASGKLNVIWYVLGLILISMLLGFIYKRIKN